MEKVFIIAEAGVNHNGDLDLARKLIDVAVDAGADAVKFQTFKSERLVKKTAEKADYQKDTTGAHETQFQMLKRLELDASDHKILIDYCNGKNILFLSTPFDMESIRLLYDFDMPIFKAPSGELTNIPYLRAVGALGKKIILSTGLANLAEISKALQTLEGAGTPRDRITVLHANTAYPTPMEDVNLNAMRTIADRFKVKVGYSDHTLGIEVPIAAVALGASVIEKHFTLDRDMEGPDHRASLEPDELKNMVSAIRNIEQALGNGLKQASKSELKNISVARKSIVAAKEIKKGDILTSDNLVTKRPDNGISSLRWDEVLGLKASQNYMPDDLITEVLPGLQKADII